MAKAVEIILEKKPDFIDVNMGCPIKKVIKRGAGSALMKNPEKAEAIIREMKNVLEMLLYQGVEQFELWTGKPAPVAVMREALSIALGRK